MKRLLRFEDRYGTADIFCKVHNIPYVPFGETLYKTTTDVLMPGLSNPGCLVISKRKAESLLRENSVDRIVVLFDMDSPSDPNFAVTAEEFRRQASSNELITYAPIVWCAETWQHICMGIEIDELLHPPKKVLQSLKEHFPHISGKQTRNYISEFDIRSLLLEWESKTRYNQKALEVILHGTLGYTFDETLAFLQQF